MVQDPGGNRKKRDLPQDEYDDRMIASIELKSDDFNNENFSPVFSRLKKESVLTPGEKYHRDIAIVPPIAIAAEQDVRPEEPGRDPREVLRRQARQQPLERVAS